MKITKMRESAIRVYLIFAIVAQLILLPVHLPKPEPTVYTNPANNISIIYNVETNDLIKILSNEGEQFELKSAKWRVMEYKKSGTFVIPKQ